MPWGCLAGWAPAFAQRPVLDDHDWEGRPEGAPWAEGLPLVLLPPAEDSLPEPMEAPLLSLPGFVGALP